MVFAIELYFDPDSEARIVGLWETLARRTSGAARPDPGARPHISLAVLENPDTALLLEELRAFARSLSPFTLKLSAVGTFPTLEGVVFLAPVVTFELLEIHRQLQARLEALGVPLNAYYRPGQWIPHCTAATGLPPDQVALAVEVCRNSRVFQEVTITEVGLIGVPPFKTIAAFPLGG